MKKLFIIAALLCVASCGEEKSSSETINELKSPVVVISTSNRAEQYLTFKIVLKDGNGRLVSVEGDEYRTFFIGDTIK